MDGVTFDVEEVGLQFDLQALQSLLVCNNIMFLVLPSTVYKIDLENPTIVKQFKFAAENTITSQYLSPNGQHFVLEINSSVYYYLHDSYDKFKVLSKWKNLQFDSVVVASESEAELDAIIVSGDKLYFANLKSHATLDNKKDDKILKQIYSSAQPIASVDFQGTRLRIYLQTKILNYDVFEPSYGELLTVLKTSPATEEILPIAFTNEKLVITKNGDLITEDEEIRISNKKLKPNFTSIVLTNHFLVSLAEDGTKLHINSKLSDDYLEFQLPNQISGITADYTKNTFWLYNHTNIYELIINNEASNVWLQYYKLGKYDQALKVLKDDNLYKKDMILVKQGYDLLQRGGYGNNVLDYGLLKTQIEGIRILAKLSEPFEKICLMLMNNDNKIISNKLLIQYLLVKFQSNLKHENNRIRSVILSTWIVELMLRNLYLSEQGTSGELSDFAQQAKEEFTRFVTTHHKQLDKATIYTITSQYNMKDKLIIIAELYKDYKHILDYYMELKDWANCLKVLVKLYNSEEPSQFNTTIKTYSTTLIIEYPQETFELLLKFNTVDYEVLLPNILIYNKKNTNFKENHGINFLSKVIFSKSIKTPNIINYYLSLMITHSSGDRNVIENKVLKTLNFIKYNEKLFDLKLITRLCLNNHYYKPAIIMLITNLKLFEPALTIALTNDLVDLAIFVLNKFSNYLKKGDISVGEDEEEDDDYHDVEVDRNKLQHHLFGLGKKLWLMFAKYLILGVIKGQKFEILDEVEESDDDSRKALKYLLDASYNANINGNFLTLKDLLPLFPETIMVNNFKSEIISSLNTYNSKLNQLSTEMTESVNISNKLIQQINEFSINDATKILTIIEPGDSCRMCGKLLVTKKIISFPNCHHNFHKDCLIKYYLLEKNDYRFKKIFNRFKNKQDGWERSKTELDEILLSDCVLCNESNIFTIDDNLIGPADSELAAQWELA